MQKSLPIYFETFSEQTLSGMLWTTSTGTEAGGRDSVPEALGGGLQILGTGADAVQLCTQAARPPLRCVQTALPLPPCQASK